MERIEQYRQVIQRLLEAHQEHSDQNLQNYPEAEIIIDQEKNHYLLIYVGKYNEAGIRQYGCILHIDIKDEKIWIQRDGTEEGFATQLVEQGIPSQDIVLGYKSPFMRQHTGYAVG